MSLKDVVISDSDIFINANDFAEALVWMHDGIPKIIYGNMDYSFTEISPHDTEIENMIVQATVKAADVEGIARNDTIEMANEQYYVYKPEPNPPGLMILYLSKDPVYEDPEA